MMRIVAFLLISCVAVMLGYTGGKLIIAMFIDHDTAGEILSHWQDAAATAVALTIAVYTAFVLDFLGFRAKSRERLTRADKGAAMGRSGLDGDNASGLQAMRGNSMVGPER